MVQRIVELLRASHYKGDSDVPRQEFLLGLITAIQALPDDEWERLSEEAQLWSNAATAAKRNNEPISDPNGHDITEELHVKHKTTKRANKLASKANGNGKATPVRTAKKSGHTYNDVLMRTVLQNPKISKDDLMQKMRKAGYNPVSWTVSAYSTRFRQALKFLQKEGLLKREVL